MDYSHQMKLFAFFPHVQYGITESAEAIQALWVGRDVSSTVRYKQGAYILLCLLSVHFIMPGLYLLGHFLVYYIANLDSFPS